MPAAPALCSVSESLRLRMVEAVADHDREALHLLMELTVAQLGTAAAMEAVAALPTAVPSSDVKTCLQMLHGPDRWIPAARGMVFAACEELSRHGSTPGEDFSFDSKPSGEPILRMTRLFYSALNDVVPGALHLVRCFLRVEQG